jgi:hypothetical protein
MLGQGQSETLRGINGAEWNYEVARGCRQRNLKNQIKKEKKRIHSQTSEEKTGEKVTISVRFGDVVLIEIKSDVSWGS